MQTHGAASQPRNRREVARTFEKQLIEQFVGVMMEGVFNASPETAGPLSTAGREEQKQMWVSQMAEHLTSSGGLGLADKLLAQWEQRFGPESDTSDEKSVTP